MAVAPMVNKSIPVSPVAAPRRVTILGATGSIGASTLDIVTRFPEQLRVGALTAHRNVEALAALARQHKAERAVIADPTLYNALREALAGTPIRAEAGEEALQTAAASEADIVVSAMVGAAGLAPTLAAAEAGRTIALANKECLVCAGELLLAAAKAHGAQLVPVDSEHNAIFQIFPFAAPQSVHHITLTASGGPFRTLPLEALEHVTPEQAVKHPNWQMGAKISVDSATLMNKGLELIEAYYLFPVRAEQIEVLIHPESVIHGLVHGVDGSVLAGLSMPDMRVPIAHALAHGLKLDTRLATAAPPLDLAALGRLQFERVDHTRFPALKLAQEALQIGGAAPIILNAANEVAVAAFLAGGIGFRDIVTIVREALEHLPHTAPHTMEDVHIIDREARTQAQHYCQQRRR